MRSGRGSGGQPARHPSLYSAKYLTYRIATDTVVTWPPPSVDRRTIRPRSTTGRSRTCRSSGAPWRAPPPSRTSPARGWSRSGHRPSRRPRWRPAAHRRPLAHGLAGARPSSGGARGSGTMWHKMRRRVAHRAVPRCSARRPESSSSASGPHCSPAPCSPSHWSIRRRSGVESARGAGGCCQASGCSSTAWDHHRRRALGARRPDDGHRIHAPRRDGAVLRLPSMATCCSRSDSARCTSRFGVYIARRHGG